VLKPAIEVRKKIGIMPQSPDVLKYTEIGGQAYPVRESFEG